MKKETCVLINISILRDKNVLNKKVENILQYKDLTTETHRPLNVKTKVVPAVTSATGTFSKSFTKYLSNIPGKHYIEKLQQTAILGTAQHSSKSTNVQAQNVYGGK
jgi:hypothetical protein